MNVVLYLQANKLRHIIEVLINLIDIIDIKCTSGLRDSRNFLLR